MKLKVCGMKYPDNISAISLLEPDFMGFIFYPKSARFIDIKSMRVFLNKPWKCNIKKVGVFVNEPIESLLKIAKKAKLDYVQLHGDETPDYAKKAHLQGLKIIKAFQISDHFSWSVPKKFTPYCKFFLFDTASKQYGGSGQKFNWKQLENYDQNLPFFISGGIETNDIKDIKKMSVPTLYGIDVNSKMEIKPGLKNVELVRKLVKELNA